MAGGVPSAISRARSAPITPGPDGISPTRPIASAPAAETAASAAPDPAPGPTSLSNPFIQVGLFSVEANANSAASALRQEGIVPSVLYGERDDGTPFYRVVIGPVTTADDQAAMLNRVKQLGYSDAFLAPN